VEECHAPAGVENVKSTTVRRGRKKDLIDLLCYLLSLKGNDQVQ
jgi:hypothetical protein